MTWGLLGLQAGEFFFFFFSGLELNSAGHRHSRTDVAYPCPVPRLQCGKLPSSHNETVPWMTRNLAPESMLQVVHCSCKQGKCETERCSCLSPGLCCIDLCQLRWPDVPILTRRTTANIVQMFPRKQRKEIHGMKLWWEWYGWYWRVKMCCFIF